MQNLQKQAASDAFWIGDSRAANALYEITDAKGRHLCYQVGRCAAEAVASARDFYGYPRARNATYVRDAS